MLKNKKNNKDKKQKRIKIIESNKYEIEQQ